jgi:hypothetical protein
MTRTAQRVGRQIIRMAAMFPEGQGTGGQAQLLSRDTMPHSLLHGPAVEGHGLHACIVFGFTPELLTVVWVGLDDNTALGLSGAQAALPIWTTFMIRALAGHANLPLPQPETIVFAEIDRDNGERAVPGCPRVLMEAFFPGTEPTKTCGLHR